jgi:hypothetical protein
LRIALRLSGFLALALATCLTADDVRAMPEVDIRPIGKNAVATAPESVFDTFLDRLMQAESGGRDTAANPRSSAIGPFQFIKATFLDLVRRHFLVETDTLTSAQVLDLRMNRRFARRAAAIYSRENLALLGAHGLVPTFGHLRLAFLVGSSAAARLIKAGPETPVANLLSAAVIKANPFMTSLSASDLIARAERDIGGDRNQLIASAPPPRERVVALRPDPRESRVNGSIPESKTGKPTCNTGLASCRRWVAMQNKQRVLPERAPSLSHTEKRAGKQAGRPRV